MNEEVLIENVLEADEEMVKAMVRSAEAGEKIGILQSSGERLCPLDSDRIYDGVRGGGKLCKVKFEVEVIK